MKRTLLALLLCLCVALLAACQSGEPQRFDALGNNNSGQDSQNTGNADTPSGDSNINFDDGTYDPASEEGRGDDLLGGFTFVTPPSDYITATPTVRSQYAGATPVPTDPIDKPTATVVPPLTFTYTVYDATKLGLSFDGPIGWVVDDSASDTYIIYNPDPSVDYAATLTLRATPVASDYSESDLRREVLGMLSSIGSSGFSTWSPSNTATRSLLTASGVYANYTGTLNGGIEVAGRVQAACLNRVLYTVHITYPRAYTDTYKNGVYDKLRDTIKVTK